MQLLLEADRAVGRPAEARLPSRSDGHECRDLRGHSRHQPLRLAGAEDRSRRGGRRRSSSGITIPLIAVPDDEVSQGLQVNEWDVVNQSAGGLKVKRAGRHEPEHRRGRGHRHQVHRQARAGPSAWCAGSRCSTTAAWNSASSSSRPPRARVAVHADDHLGRHGEARPAAARIGAVAATRTRCSRRRRPTRTCASSRSRRTARWCCVRATSLIEKTGRFELFHISPS